MEVKKILITGANSYIGTSFEQYLKQWPSDYQVDTIDMKDRLWKEKSFLGYDSVFHVAGIAHIKETKENSHLYYEINRDLAVETAKKAKAEGVKQFVFLSSMSVYGVNTGAITKDTRPAPTTNYGKSKLEAEIELNDLKNESFLLTVLRPPMVYGNGCKGNFQTVIKIVSKSPLFPYVKNQRSMIYIEHLCNFVKLMIDEEKPGVFYPQNQEFIETSHMAKLIGDTMNKKVYLSKLGGIVIVLFRPFIPNLRKAFGTMIYSGTEQFDFRYCTIAVDESIRKSV